MTQKRINKKLKALGMKMLDPTFYENNDYNLIAFEAYHKKTKELFMFTIYRDLHRIEVELVLGG